MSSRRPSARALEVEADVVARATSAGQGNRTRSREHGDLAMHQWGPSGKDRSNGCRCETCVESARAYKRRYARQQTANRGGGFVAVRDVRPHVRRLLALGWQIQQIADAAGTSKNAVSRIGRGSDLNGDVNRATARALLAIPAIARHRLPRFAIEQAMLRRAEDIQRGRWIPTRDAGRYAETWRASAACADLHPDSMQPGRGDAIDANRALCAVCPVKDACGEAGLYEKYGIWGGLSEKERRRLRKARGIRIEDDDVLELNREVAA